MKRLKGIIAVMFVAFLLFSTNAFAGRKTVFLEDQQIFDCTLLSRSRSYSYVTARCYSVYPTNGGTDTFSRIQSQVLDPSTSFPISSLITLTETDPLFTNIQIYQGYLHLFQVTIGFRGNSPTYPAYADVYYNGN